MRHVRRATEAAVLSLATAHAWQLAALAARALISWVGWQRYRHVQDPTITRRLIREIAR